MIQINHLTKCYKEFKALDDVSLTIDKPLTIILGKSGSGKSTLLHAIGTLDNDYQGEIIINKMVLKDKKEKEQALFRNKNLGFVFQKFYLEPEYTVFENVLVPLFVQKMSKKERNERVNEALMKVGLLDKSKNKAKNISGGEAQRVAIARALVVNPDIVLADEPCGNLDTLNGRAIMDIFKSISKEGRMVIIVTHNNEHLKYADDIIKLEDGKIVK